MAYELTSKRDATCLEEKALKVHFQDWKSIPPERFLGEQTTNDQ